ncbi:MAG: hypothetical protein ACK5ZG_12375 [Phycisphaerae bacterium]
MTEPRNTPSANPACWQPTRCPACGVSPLQLVWVHSHEQTACCGLVIGPCCQPQAALDHSADDDNHPG